MRRSHSDFPQLPQLFALVFTSTQAGPHEVCPVAHPATHAPATHELAGPHVLPHDPQLRASVCVSVQRPLHVVSPAGQTQALPAQLAPTPHCVPHVPQSNGSDVRLTHALLQLFSPAAHVVVHTPSEHTWPAAHAVLQPPQLFGSLLMSVHTPRQRMPPL